jgi:thymidylate synthase
MRGKLFSCLGELLWYLRGSNELAVISNYLPKYGEDSDDGRTLYGAYGPRLFGMHGHDQIQNVLDKLKDKPMSRRAVIQLFDAADVPSGAKEIPCTCTIQILLRRKKLEMFTMMRSNDAFKGLPHDLFAFTMLQEILARSLDADVGVYKHAVGSLHLYETDVEKAQGYLDEGWQSSTAMPAMPSGNPWPAINSLLQIEKSLRENGDIDLANTALDSYWLDIAQLLKIFQLGKNGDRAGIAAIKKKMSTKLYNIYIDNRGRRGASTTGPQLEIDDLTSKGH